MALEIGLDLTETLGLPAERILRMHIGVVIDHDEGFELHAEPLGIVEIAAMVIGDAPGAGIEIKPGIEAAFLHLPAHIGEDIAAADRHGAPADAVVVLDQLNFIAGIAQF